MMWKWKNLKTHSKKHLVCNGPMIETDLYLPYSFKTGFLEIKITNWWLWRWQTSLWHLALSIFWCYARKWCLMLAKRKDLEGNWVRAQCHWYKTSRWMQNCPLAKHGQWGQASVRNMCSNVWCSFVLHFTFRRAVCCILHQPLSQVIHCAVLSLQAKTNNYKADVRRGEVRWFGQVRSGVARLLVWQAAEMPPKTLARKKIYCSL